MTMKNKKTILTIAVIALVLAACIVLDILLPTYHIAITVIKKASVYALVAVSMNLLNGFTGLFSLGQAGFMLLGAYAYAVLTIPMAKRPIVYQYFDGGALTFSLPEVFGGGAVGEFIGMMVALLIGGILAALIAYLIGLPVLRLKSDYLAIATLGFAEILRAFFQWNALGPITNGSNLLKSYPAFSHATPYVVLGGLMIAIILLIINSTYGRAFKAIREDEIAAEAMGINLAKAVVESMANMRRNRERFVIKEPVLNTKMVDVNLYLRCNEEKKTSYAIRKDGMEVAPEGLHFLTIGKEVCFIGVPGELLGEVGLMMKWCSPFRKTFVLYNSTDYVGYLCHPNVYVSKGFEYNGALFHSLTGFKLLQAAVRNMYELRGDEFAEELPELDDLK